MLLHFKHWSLNFSSSRSADTISPALKDKQLPVEALVKLILTIFCRDAPIIGIGRLVHWHRLIVVYTICYWNSRVREADGNVKELWKTISDLLVPNLSLIHI